MKKLISLIVLVLPFLASAQRIRVEADPKTKIDLISKKFLLGHERKDIQNLIFDYIMDDYVIYQRKNERVSFLKVDLKKAKISYHFYKDSLMFIEITVPAVLQEELYKKIGDNFGSFNRSYTRNGVLKYIWFGNNTFIDFDLSKELGFKLAIWDVHLSKRYYAEHPDVVAHAENPDSDGE